MHSGPCHAGQSASGCAGGDRPPGAWLPSSDAVICRGKQDKGLSNCIILISEG